MAAEALEKSVLEGKDREQLMAIAQALGVKSVSRAKKAELIDKILEQTSTPEPVAKPAAKSAPAATPAPATKAEPREPRVVLGPDGEPLADWEIELAEHEGTLDETVAAGGSQRNDRGPRNNDGQRNDRGPRNESRNEGGQRGEFQQRDGQRDGQQRRDFDGEGGNRNRRRRRRNKNRRDDIAPQGDDRYEIDAP
ncbi:MAG: Rho termination factor N-terminal domain-containing protein, partial [Actinomycetota bacterium]